jgi:hypothetical protein
MLGGRWFGFGAFVSSAWLMAAPVPGGCGGIGGGSGGATPNSVCGNGVWEGPYEECDGSAFQQQTCAEVSSDYGRGGRLKCTRDCKVDLSECRRTVCGDGVIEGWEICEGNTFAPGVPTSCLDIGALGGTLRCSACQLDYDGCITDICGNGQLDATEACEGNEFRYGYDRCEDFDGSKYAGGTLSCNANCTPNTSACVPIVCGNGVVEATESCDGANLGDRQTCAAVSEGYVGGVLKCGADCEYDVSSCQLPVCGDGRIEGFEQCDGSASGHDCSDFIYGVSVFGIQTPFRPGPLTCSRSSCQFDLSQCRPQPGCYLTSNCGPLPTRPCLPTLHCVP